MTHLDDPYRLPRAVVPRRYDVELTPELEHATFSGVVTIDADVVDDCSEIVMNAKDLDISEVSVNGETHEFFLDHDTERVVVGASGRTGQTLRISFSFNGVLNDKLRGFYRSTFVDSDGVTRTIATTQMQNTDCRRAFPCFDEPDFKAVFAITLVTDPDVLAISNGAELTREPIGDKVRVRFADTIPMSTYLVAFVVGPLEATPPVMVDGIALRVVHVPGKGHLTSYSLAAAAAAVSWFSRYYDIPYPGDKIDLVALPDFAAGAMENFGCITFREILLLIDEKTATQGEKQVLVDVVSHELAHMWFGDMVTMRWWNGIWLNEAFATFMEVAATDAFAPHWNRWTSFAVDRTPAFDTDSLLNSRPIEFEVRSPDDCEGMFDVLTYEKGGSILRMLQQALGEETFRKGVSHYLSKHMYGNTDTSDLWDAIEESLDSTDAFPVRKMMDSWIWQAGYPVVTATVDAGELRLSQTRFTFQPSDDATTWVVPVHVRVGGDTSMHILDGAATNTGVHVPDSAPVIVNAGGSGFFRVRYSHELLGRFSSQVIASMTELERYGIIDDTWNAVVAGELHATDFLTLASSFGNERSYVVWVALAQGLRSVWRIVGDDDLAPFADTVRTLARPVLAEIGWEPAPSEDEIASKLRGLVISLLAIQGRDDKVRERCHTIFMANEHVHPEVFAAATQVTASFGGEAEFEEFLSRFRSAPTPQEQIRALYALGEFNDPQLVDRVVEFAFSPEVKSQNAPFLLNRCLNNRAMGPRAWTAVRKRWQEVVQRFPVNTVIRVPQGARDITDPATVADMQAFFAEHPITQSVKPLAQTLERQQVNASLRQREQSLLAAAFRGE